MAPSHPSAKPSSRESASVDATMEKLSLQFRGRTRTMSAQRITPLAPTKQMLSQRSVTTLESKTRPPSAPSLTSSSLRRLTWRLSGPPTSPWSSTQPSISFSLRTRQICLSRQPRLSTNHAWTPSMAPLAQNGSSTQQRSARRAVSWRRTTC